VRCPHGIDPSLICEGENGYFVDCLSAQEIANKLVQLLNRLDIVKANAVRSTEMAARYDWNAVANQHEQAYKRICRIT
jgi:glycosyltransferase involved in cell wall biosynthesis